MRFNGSCGSSVLVFVVFIVVAIRHGNIGSGSLQYLLGSRGKGPILLLLFAKLKAGKKIVVVVVVLVTFFI